MEQMGKEENGLGLTGKGWTLIKVVDEKDVTSTVRMYYDSWPIKQLITKDLNRTVDYY